MNKEEIYRNRLNHSSPNVCGVVDVLSNDWKSIKDIRKLNNGICGSSLSKVIRDLFDAGFIEKNKLEKRGLRRFTYMRLTQESNK